MERHRAWPALTLLLLVPLWCLGMFGRTAWTPDEPREYDISLNMLEQANLNGLSGIVIPRLAGEPFLEKPPLTYWAAAAALKVFGPTPTAARVPNLLWAMLTVLAVGALAASFVREHGAATLKGALANDQGAHKAALVAALVCGTLALIFQIQIWLATDAPLLAATAVSLLGAWRMTHSESSGKRLLWALIFWTGIALAFFAKNIFGCLVPLGALVLWIVWEGRWRELGRWQLYAGALLPLASVALWIVAVAHGPDGPQNLRIFLWDNNFGRVLPVATQEQYQLGHRNTPFQILIVVPWFLMPWTFVVLAAVRWAWKELRGAGYASTGVSNGARVRASATTSTSTLTHKSTSSSSGPTSGAATIGATGAAASAIRFCAVATLPVLLLLCVSHTARSVYCGPVLLVLPALLGLWFVGREVQLNPSVFDERRFDNVRSYEADVAGVSFDKAAFGKARVGSGSLEEAPFDLFERRCMQLTRVSLLLLSALLGLLALLVTVFNIGDLSIGHLLTGLVAVGLVTWVAARWRRHAPTPLLLRNVTLYVSMLICAEALLFPLLDRAQDLGALTKQAAPQLSLGPLAVWRSDETIRAALDYGAGLRPVNVRTLEEASELLHRDPTQRFLVQTDSAKMAISVPKALSRFLGRYDQKRSRRKSAALAGMLSLGLQTLQQWSVPGGRQYVLLGRGPATDPDR